MCTGSGARRRPRPRSSSGSAAHPTTRASSPRSTRIPMPTATPAAQAGLPCLSPSTRSRTRATSARSVALAEQAGAAGLVIPERRAAEVTAVACKASAGAVEHLAIARVRNLADWLAEAKEAGFWIWGADAGASRALGGRPERPDDPRHGGRGEWDPTPRGRACDGLVALPAKGQDRLAQRLRGGHGAALRGPSPALLSHFGIGPLALATAVART